MDTSSLLLAAKTVPFRSVINPSALAKLTVANPSPSSARLNAVATKVSGPGAASVAGPVGTSNTVAASGYYVNAGTTDDGSDNTKKILAIGGAALAALVVVAVVVKAKKKKR